VAPEFLGVDDEDAAGLGGRVRSMAAFCPKDWVVGIDDKELAAGRIGGFSASCGFEARLAAVRDQALKGIGLEKFRTRVSGSLFANVPFCDTGWFETCPADEDSLTIAVPEAGEED
jgi:hypothetical protein